MEEERVKALVVEDNWVVSEEIKRVLLQNDIEVVGQEADGASALAIVKERSIDLAVVDISIEGAMDGIELAHQINAIQTTPIIFLTAHEDQSIIERAKEVLPAAYMLKPLHPKNLLIAIDLAFDKFKKGVLSGQHELTPQELKIVNMIAQGLTNQAISDELNISPQTVKTHRKNILKKTKCSNFTQLVSEFVRDGIL